MKLINKIKEKTQDFKKKQAKSQKANKKTIQKEKQAMEKELAIDKLPEKNTFLKEMVTFSFLFRTGIVLILLAYIWFVSYQSLNIIYMILTAFILSIAMETIVGFISKKLPRSISIILAYIFIAVFLLLGFLLLIPFIAQQMSSIIDILSVKIDSLKYLIQTKTLPEIVNWFPLPTYFKNIIVNYVSDPEIATKLTTALSENVSNLAQKMGNYFSSISNFAINTVASIFSILSQIVMVFILSVFFSFEKDRVVYTISHLTDQPRKTWKKLAKLYLQLGAWLKWQLLLCVFIWVSTYVGLWSISLLGINIPDKFILAVIAGITEFIPYLWPIFGAIPALLVASIHFGFMGFLSVLILFTVIQQFEWILVPIVMNKALWISSLLIFIAMLIWVQIMWFIGVILAIPLAVIVSILFEDTLKSKEENKEKLRK